MTHIDTESGELWKKLSFKDNSEHSITQTSREGATKKLQVHRCLKAHPEIWCTDFSKIHKFGSHKRPIPLAVVYHRPIMYSCEEMLVGRGEDLRREPRKDAKKCQEIDSKPGRRVEGERKWKFWNHHVWKLPQLLMNCRVFKQVEIEMDFQICQWWSQNVPNIWPLQHQWKTSLLKCRLKLVLKHVQYNFPGKPDEAHSALPLIHVPALTCWDCPSVLYVPNYMIPARLNEWSPALTKPGQVRWCHVCKMQFWNKCSYVKCHLAITAWQIG